MNVARWPLALLGLAAPLIADAQEVSLPALPPAQPVTRAYGDAGPAGIMPDAPHQTMTIWRAGAATCDGEPVAVTRAPNPLPTLSWGTGAEAPLRFAFHIDATGRPVSIQREERGHAASASDLMPSLAAAAFAPALHGANA